LGIGSPRRHPDRLPILEFRAFCATAPGRARGRHAAGRGVSCGVTGTSRDPAARRRMFEGAGADAAGAPVASRAARARA